MVKRICPNCGLPWYSAAAHGTWTCQECGGVLTRDNEVEMERSECVGSFQGVNIERLPADW